MGMGVSEMRFGLRRRSGIGLWKVSLISVLLIVLYAFWIVENHLKPTLLVLAEAKATVIATQAINDVINTKVSQTIDPQSMVTVRVDSRGRVVLIQPNTMEFNKLAADTTMKVQKTLQEITEEQVYIPLGQVFGSQMLASLGPKIPITIIPIGTVQVKVVDKFEQAGINQTRHMVFLVITTQIRIVVPMVGKTVSVNTQVPIAEYVVVGEVPNTYVQFPYPLANELVGNGNGGSEHIN
jgi:sporulation protein YunB